MECIDLLVKAAYLLAATDQELVPAVGHRVDAIDTTPRLRGASAAGRELMAWLDWRLEVDEIEGLSKNSSKAYTATIPGGEHAGLTRTIAFKTRRFYEKPDSDSPMKGYNINWEMHRAYVKARPELWYVCVPSMKVLPATDAWAMAEPKSGSAKNGPPYRIAWPDKLLPVEALLWSEEKVLEALTALGRPNTLFEAPVA